MFTLSAEKAALFVPRRALICIKANRSHLTQVSYSRAAQQSPRHTIEARVSGDARDALNAAQNKLQTALRTAAALLESSRDVLQRHLTCAHARHGTD